MTRDREIDFLIACAAPPGRLDAARLEASGAGLDWTAMEALAAYHRVRPLLFRRARFAPEAALAAWDQSLKAGAVQTLNLAGSLIAVARALATAGVPALPHKGPLLALSAYGDLGLRECGDLDLLVPADRLAAALEALAAAGYERDAGVAWLSATALRRWTGEVPCVSAAGVAVDLHWRLTPPTYPVQLPPEILWEHTAELEIAGATLTTLAPEALFLLLAVHGAKHAWEAMGWLADLAWLVESHASFDWDRVNDLAERAGCERVLNLAGALIEAVFHTPLTASRRRAIAADPAARRLKALVLRRWREGPIASPGSLELLRFVALLSPNRAAVARHILSLILDPTEVEWRARRLPESLFALYAPGRLLRLAVKRLGPRGRG